MRWAISGGAGFLGLHLARRLLAEGHSVRPLDVAPLGLELVVVRPKTFIGPERLGVFEILFDWVHDGRRIYMLGDGSNRYQLLAVEDLVEAVVLAAEADDAAGEAINVGAQEFGT